MFLTVKIPRLRKEEYKVIKPLNRTTKREKLLTAAGTVGAVAAVQPFLIAIPTGSLPAFALEQKMLGVWNSLDLAVPAMAQSADVLNIKDKIIAAFDPIVELMKGLAYPVSSIMIVAGCLMVMIGQKHRGINTMKWAGVGFLMVQFAPTIMKILVDLGTNISK